MWLVTLLSAYAAIVAQQRQRRNLPAQQACPRAPGPMHACASRVPRMRAAPRLWIRVRRQVDLDLGNYERFLDITLTRDNNITTGKIYQVRRCGGNAPGWGARATRARRGVETARRHSGAAQQRGWGTALFSSSKRQRMPGGRVGLG